MEQSEDMPLPATQWLRVMDVATLLFPTAPGCAVGKGGPGV